MLKLGLIGCGKISEKHLMAVSEVERAIFVSVCDIDIEKAEEKARKFGINKVYSDYKQMLKHEKLDAVAICTPNASHPVIGIEAAKHKVNVISEKPMAINIADADNFIKICDENKVKLFVVKQNRLTSTMLLLKKAVQKNRFGKIYQVQANVFWQRPQHYYDSANWRGTINIDGGAVMNQASHYVDALYWLFGQVESVYAVKKTMARQIEAEDSAVAVLNFKNGCIGTLNVSMLTYPKNFEASITVLGEKGTVKIGGTAINKFEKWEFADYDDDDSLVQPGSYIIAQSAHLGHKKYYENVLDVIKNNGVAVTDGRDGRFSLEIIEAIYKSSNTNKLVKLPLK